jgi:two-component system, cell cycle sensor histidine kinase and response regulator CckA
MTGARPGYDLSAFQRAQFLSSREMVARMCVIIGGALGVWFGLGLWWPMVWTLSYVICALAYHLTTRSFPDRIGRRQLTIVIGFEAFLTLHWPVLFVYLWRQDHDATLFIDTLILAAAMTNALSARCEDTILTWSDRIVVAVLLGLAVLLFSLEAESTASTVVVLVVCLLMYIWMLVTLAEVSAMRRRLAQAERTAMEQQRIEAIGRLTGGVAHDFNNILTVIGGNLDLVREVSDPSEKLALLAEARSATGRAAAVTAQLLAYSRQSVLAPRSTALVECLARVEAFMSRLLPTAVRLTLHVAADLPVIEIDATRLESALINLILNSRDAMPGGGAITLSAHTIATDPSAPDAPAHVVVAVADTGQGIDPAILPRVFEPYFTTKPVGKGSGLGLSMAKGFAEQSGGNLTIRSVPGNGTVVEMILPVRPAAAAVQSAAVRWSATMATMRSSGT